MVQPVAGLVLCGGLARRMGGGDKSLRPLSGRPMLDWILQRLGPQCSRLVLNVNGDASRFARYRLPVVADDVPGFAGPLAGILAGLDWVAAHAPEVDAAVSVAGDTPFLPCDLIERLLNARRAAGADVASAASGGRVHPVVSLWPIALRGDLRKALVEQGERKIQAFTARYRMAMAEWPTEPFDPFFNVNAPDDLAQAEILARILSTMEPPGA